MTVEAPGAMPASPLRGLCGGAVLLPGDAGFAAALAAGNLGPDQQPAAIAYPGDAAEVAEVVRAAVAAGLRIAPQGAGHNAGPLNSLGDVVLLRTAGMVRVDVDPLARRARVQAGARWVDAIEAAAPLGLSARHGSSPDVGIVGYTLGGGIGWYGRALGQQSATVTAAELVTAEGVSVRVDRDHDPELLWALRGGGGSLGVVTALEFGLDPTTDVYAGLLSWDHKHLAPVAHRWVQWCAEVPEAVTSILRIRHMPTTHRTPLPLRGRTMVSVLAAIRGGESEAARLLAPLRELGPELDTFEPRGAADLVGPRTVHREPASLVADSALLRSMPVDAIAALVATEAGSTLSLVELRHLGGALARPDAASALSAVEGEFLLFVAGRSAHRAERPVVAEHVARVMAALRPYATGVPYLNFTTRPVDVSRAFAPAAWQRLRALRAAVDPHEVFVANHPVPPAPKAP